MALISGTKLGPYEIQSPLGAGGMGEVYRARDTRLGRDVAIKILPQHLSCDPDLKARFEREARAISALSHPHICHLYDIGSQDGTDYLVMELLDGETLADRLQKGGLPLKQALEYGIEIAEALEKAQKTGIVHRDLKPGNIFLTKEGAKLLDFGLAKQAAGMAAMASGSMDTMSRPLTGEGKMVGTYQYMAPEQIHGNNADARTDIFALGAVLYEMLTGRRAFEGKNEISVMSAILEKEPEPVSTAKPLTPPALDHVIQRALAKDPEERWQSAADLRAELRWIAGGGSQAGAPTVASRKEHKWFAMMLIGILIAALAMASTYYQMKAAPQAPLMVSVVPPAGVFADTLGRNGPPQISPDGSRVAFVGCKTEAASSSLAGGSKACSIWLQSLHSTDAHEVAGTSGGYLPFWSPDGAEIGFFADGKMKRVHADGGPVQLICDAEDARGGSWGVSGIIIFSPTRGSPILRVPADGGTPVAITHFAAPTSNLSYFGSHRWPHFLPDGEHFLYLSQPNGACNDLGEMHFASIDGKQDSALMRTCNSGVFASGRLLYWRDGNLVAQPFEPRHGVLSGVAVPIVGQVGLDWTFSSGEFSASSDDKLLYVPGEGITGAQLVWYDRAGRMLGTLGGSNAFSSVAISRDGSRVATDIAELGKKTNVQVIAVKENRNLMTFGVGEVGFPTWSPDGRQIYFTSNVNGPFDVFVKPADGSASEHEVVKFDNNQLGAAFLAASPDGKYLAYAVIDRDAKQDIYTVSLTGDVKPSLFLHSASVPTFSPDGRWLAYESTQSGTKEIYITPFPGGGAQYQVSTNSGERPVWSRDGKKLFYREFLTLMAVEVNSRGSTIQFSTPKALFEIAVRNLGGRWYDVSPDGRFLMNTTPATSQPRNFQLLVNWPAELKK